MISAIVLAPDLVGDEDTLRLAEIVVRSLTWLVSAVVAGVVRDVTLAAPAGLGLGQLADQAGCELVQGDREADRLTDALRVVKQPVILVVRAGFVPEIGLVSEIDDLLRHEPNPMARVLAAPRGLMERLFPDRGQALGVLLPAPKLTPKGTLDFRALVRATQGAKPLRHRAFEIG